MHYWIIDILSYKKTLFSDNEHKILFHLNCKNFKCPKPHLFDCRQNLHYFYIDKNSEIYYNDVDSLISLKEAKKPLYIARMLQFITGKTISEVNAYSKQLLFSVGSYAAYLDVALKV